MITCTQVIQKLVFKISRVVFLSVFFVLSISFVAWEVVFLSNVSKKEVVFGMNKIQPGQTNQVLIGEANNNSSLEMTSRVAGDDARPVLIKKYLEKYKSPLAPYSDLIFQLSQTYGYDYYWIVAIAQQESNLCKVIPDGSHNCWGYGINKAGTLKFDNYELALKSYAEYLKREYFDKGYTTPEQMMKKYCPSSNGSWAAGVQQFIDQMKTGNF
jgi:hypothetical protein